MSGKICYNFFFLSSAHTNDDDNIFNAPHVNTFSKKLFKKTNASVFTEHMFFCFFFETCSYFPCAHTHNLLFFHNLLLFSKVKIYGSK